MATGVGVMCCVYDDDLWLPTMVEGCYAVVEKLFFLVSRHPWMGKGGDNARTLAAIRSCPDPHGKIVIVDGDWRLEADQRNAALDVCRDARLEFCAVIDADEIYDPATLDLLIETARLQTQIHAWSIAQITYWKSYRYRIDRTGHHGQLALVRVGLVRFTHIRKTTAPVVSHLPRTLGVCHHLSYVRTDEQIVKKMGHSSHAPDFRPRWIEDVWQRWDSDPSLENLHPLRPAAFPRAVLQDPAAYPPALRRRYERDMARRIDFGDTTVGVMQSHHAPLTHG